MLRLPWISGAGPLSMTVSQLYAVNRSQVIPRDFAYRVSVSLADTTRHALKGAFLFVRPLHCSLHRISDGNVKHRGRAFGRYGEICSNNFLSYIFLSRISPTGKCE